MESVLIGAFLLFSLIVVGLLIYLGINKKSRLLAVVLIPILMANAGIMYLTITAFRGYAVATKLPQDFIVKTFAAKEDEKAIYLLIETVNNSTIRLYKVPYNKKLHQQLAEAESKTRGQGKEHLIIRGKRKTQPYGNDSDIQLGIENPIVIMPK
jgi:hypothetical protein